MVLGLVLVSGALGFGFCGIPRLDVADSWFGGIVVGVLLVILLLRVVGRAA